MHWGFALRPNNAEDSLCSFARQALSQDTYRTFEDGLGQLVDNVIGGMPKEWTDADGLNAMRAVE